MHHLSTDGVDSLCGIPVGKLFSDDESYDIIERTPLGPIIPVVWRVRKAPQDYCTKCFDLVESYEKKQIEHSVESALGPRPTHFDTDGTAMTKSVADDPWKKGW